MSERESPFDARRPRLLDLFCGAGGASRGYHDAGFEVVGVDINPQPNYPYKFIQADAIEWMSSRALWFSAWGNIDAIHASPPCQRYSDLAKRNGNADSHPDLIGPIRELLKRTGLPYVIENVEGAPLHEPWLICGTAMALGVNGYRLRRHRLFETNWPLIAPPCACREATAPVIDVSGGGPTKAPRLDGKGGRTYKGTIAEKRMAMGIDWMTSKEIVEAIPPRYTTLIGVQLAEVVQRALEAVA